MLWDGESIRKQGEDYRRDLVYIGHKSGIKGDLTGIENLRISCALDGVAISEKQAWDALEQMGLNGHEDLPAECSLRGRHDVYHWPVYW